MLNDKQKRFAQCYVSFTGDTGLNATRSYEVAYWNGERRENETATANGSKLLRHTEVSAYIQRLWRERYRKSEVKAQDIIQALSAIAFSNPKQLLNDDGSLKPLSELSDSAAAALQSFEVVQTEDGTAHLKRVRTWDKNKALDTLAKALGVIGPEMHRHVHAVVSFTPEQLEELTDKNLLKVEQAYSMLAEVEADLDSKPKQIGSRSAV